MNTWNILCTVEDYPRVLNKATNRIKFKCVNIRHAFEITQRSQHITVAIPVFAEGRVGKALLRLLKHTRYMLLSGYITLDGAGNARLVATQYTHLPGRVQQAKDYITELQERGEILGDLDRPILDLHLAGGEIRPKDPDNDTSQEWPI